MKTHGVKEETAPAHLYSVAASEAEPQSGAKQGKISKKEL